MKQGKIIIVSAPSGTGKSTIIGKLMEDANLRLQFSVSATNRAPRKGETDGVNYHFLTTEDFQRLISENAFVEYEEVYPGRFYGTLKSEVSKILESGHNLILDIDVKGGLNVKKQYPEALSLFFYATINRGLERETCRSCHRRHRHNQPTCRQSCL